MNLAQYLFATVTPLYDVIPQSCFGGGDENRQRIAEKRANEMAQRYRKVMYRKVLSSVQIGSALGITKPLCGLRKLEARGRVRVHHESREKCGRKQLFWEWVK